MNVHITLNRAAVRKKLEEKAEDALELMKDQVLKDCNYYAPQDTGILIKSSYNFSEVEKTKLIIRWGTNANWSVPYARRLYYGISPSGKPYKFSRDHNPNATKMWARKAEEQKGEQWRRQFQALLKGGK